MDIIKQREDLFQGEFSVFLEKSIQAINDHRMIEPGDKILAATSGGKDSLSMVHLLAHLYENKIFDFELSVCNIDLGYGCANRKLLGEHLNKYNIKYHFINRDILQGKSREEIGCFWCSWNRRKAIFETARDFGFNKVALGHHLDDIVHTTLMNLCLHGEISTAIPLVKLFEGKLTIIRPLCYLEEKETANFSKIMAMPIPCCSCPHKATSSRRVIKETFEPLFKDYPETKTNVIKALKSAANGESNIGDDKIFLAEQLFKE